MANREIEAILKVTSKLGNMTALRTLQRELKKVEAQATAFNRANAAMASGVNRTWMASARFITPAIAAYAGVQAFRSYADLERQIERIGITADASAGETEAAMAKMWRAAKDLHMPFDAVVNGVDGLVASGKSLDEAFALLPSVGKAAQASGADLRDMATSADAISSSFDIAANKMEYAFDIIAFLGKAGKFELKDMAAELPSLAPAFAALGYKGEEGLKKLAAALQVVRMETGTSSEAATSFMDVISKLESETVVNNFKKFGVDYRKEMKRAKDAGEDTLDAFVRLSTEAVRGDLSKLPQLFSDKQMLIGARAMINRWAEFQRMVQSTAGAMGTVEKDFQRISKNAVASIDDMANSWDRLVASVGKGIAPAVTPFMDEVSEFLDRDAAIRKYLTSQGMGFLERADFQQRRWGETQKEYDARMADAAWRGGARTEEEEGLIKAHREFAEIRAAAAADAAKYVDGNVLPHLPADKTGLPFRGPEVPFKPGTEPLTIKDGRNKDDYVGPLVPFARPSVEQMASEDFERELARQDAARTRERDYRRRVAEGLADYGRRPLHGADEPDDMTLLDRAVRSTRVGDASANNDSGGAFDTMRGGMDRLAADLKEGGDAAAQSIRDGGMEAGQSIEVAAAAIARAIEGGADYLRAAIASALAQGVNVKVSGGLPVATGNKGRTMVDAGGATDWDRN